MKRAVKKLVSLFLVVIMILGATPVGALTDIDFSGLFELTASAASYNGTCGDNLTWTLDTETGELIISGTGAMTDWPSSSNVTWKDYRTDIKTVTIADTVTSIGSFAFYDCNNLTGVTIPDSVKSIGRWAFSGYYGFTSIIIPDSVTSIGDYAFYSSSNISSVTIGKSVTSIGYSAFSYCSKLKKVYYNDSQEKWENISIGSGNDPLTSATRFYCDEFGDFYYTKGTFGDDFSYKLYDGGELVISGTGDMTDWPNQSSVPWYSCRSKIKSVTIEEGITSIGEYAFYDSSNITDVTIPDSVTKIGGYSFSFCFYLKSVDISDNVLSIGEFAFYYCESLESVTIGKGITRIDIKAFDLCGLKTVNYAGTLKEWENISIDSGNSGLKSNLICKIDPDSPYYTSGTFGKNLSWILYNDGELVISGTGSMTNWTLSSRAPWYNHHLMIKSVTIKNGVTSIGDYAFQLCPDLASVTISDSVTKIGDYSFDSCSNLTAVIIPDRVTVVGTRAFNKCYSLTSVTIGNSVSRVDDYAFFDCGGLTSVTIPDSVTSIGDSAFCNCKSLKSVNIGNSVTKIGSSAFYICKSLTSVAIPDSVTSIGSSAFYGCESLTSATIGNSVTSIGDDAFRSCKSLTSVTIPDSVTSIGNYAFCNCKSLKSVVVGNSATCISDNMFSSCDNLESVTIGKSVTSIGYSAFKGCTALKKVYYNGTAEQWIKISISIENNPLLKADIFTHEHKFTSAVTKQPTCTDEGVKTFTCDCGDSYTDVIEATGHKMGEWEYIDGNEYAKSCTVCSEKLESKTVTINMLLNGEDINKKQLLNKETAIATVTVTDNFTSDIVFVSSDDSVVSVDDKGILTANNIGKVTITVAINGTAISDSIEIEVLPRDFTIIWIVNGTETVQTVKEYEVIIPEVNTNVDGYIFNGWNGEVPETMPSNNLIFIAVLEKIVPVSVRIVKGPLKTEYIYMKEDIDISGIELEVIYSDGNRKIVDDTSLMTVSGFSNEKRGEQTVTVEYEGLTAEFKVTVKYTWWQWILVIFFFAWLWK